MSTPRTKSRDLPRIAASMLVAVSLTLGVACAPADQAAEQAAEEAEPVAAAEPAVDTPDDLPYALLVSLAVIGKTEDGKPDPLPARLGILERRDGEWTYRYTEDADSNVFHKAMAWEGAEGGVLTFGGSEAVVKLWRPDAEPEVIWREDFGGRFSRMRDAEQADLHGDGAQAIAVATHDQGVVAVLTAGEDAWNVEKIDRSEGERVFVHEIEIGDLDGDGTLEVYATPSAPNKADGTPQPGEVVRYVPETGEGRTVVGDLGDRHAKEILVTDMDGDGVDELYVAVEAVSGGQVEIRRYAADTAADAGQVIARIPDTQCRFLTAGDVDGDGSREMVAAAFKSGIWLLTPDEAGDWTTESIDTESGGFEHAAILADLDEDGSDELYVASDEHGDIRRYVWVDGEPVRETLHHYDDGLSRFTWNLMPARVEVLP